MNRFLRCMICLLLICAFMINLLPTRAEAISTGVLVAAGTVVASVLIGLGLSIGTDAVQHSDLVNGVVTWLDSAGGVITNGLISVSKLPSGHYGVPGSLIHSIFNLLYDDEVLTAGPVAAIVHEFGLDETVTTDVATVKYAYRYDNLGTIRVYYGACSLTPFRYLNATGSWKDALSNTLSDGTTFYYFGYNTITSSSNPNYNACQAFPLVGSGTLYQPRYNLQHFLGAASPSTTYDLTLGHVALPGASLATGYPAWHTNSISIPNQETGEDEEYYPLALGQTLEETQGMTQEDVWAGNGTYVDSEVVPDTGDGTITVPDNVTLKDILTGVVSIPQAISIAASNVVAAVQAIPAAIQAIPAAIADFFSVKGEVGSFTISLSDYFPFCIPFDLYDFFSCLNAEPVAPVIEWAIFERDGTAHPIIIDLSAYDSVAQLLRRLQLLLFCVGLAFKTRDLIKG